MNDRNDPSVPADSTPGGGRAALLDRHRWLGFVLPLAVFMLVGSLEPKPGDSPGALGIRYAWYPIVYTLKIALVLLAVAFVWPAYRSFPFRVSRLALGVGAVGAVVWIGICELELERRLLVPLGLEWFVASGARTAFDPFEQWARHGTAAVWCFVAIRFVGLAVAVPIVEEVFLRGFVMRFVMDTRWWAIPFGRVNATAVVVGTLVPMLMHPAELLAAAVWFSMITWLMVKTRSLWDCIAAHAVTNLLLGGYVLLAGRWHLW